MLSQEERGKESPMEIDTSSPSCWHNSPVPVTSPEKPQTPSDYLSDGSLILIFFCGLGVVFGLPPSPATIDPRETASVSSPGVKSSGFKIRRPTLFGGSPLRPQRSSPLARKNNRDESPSSETASTVPNSILTFHYCIFICRRRKRLLKRKQILTVTVTCIYL